MPKDSLVPQSFDTLGLSPAVMKALNQIGYEMPTSIQEQTIPHILEGRNLVGQAQTGTGKTAAFALPLLTRLKMDKPEIQVLVLVPTRELAIQVSEAFQKYAHDIEGFHVLPVYGGQGYGSQLRQLKRGTHVIVATPGRLCDHIRRGTLDLSALDCLVIDEADEMLRMGFIEEVDWILEQTPSTRQVVLFSATMPPAIRRIAQRHAPDPVEITIKSKTTTASTINQRYWMVSGLHKLDALTRILEGETFDAILIFVRTKTATVDLAERLEARGFATAALNGDIQQNMREATIEKLKNGDIDILVATDVAARGLDVQRISHVINYDIPYDTESYIHRVGRTGRAGRTGEAILFVAPRERRLLQAIERATKQPITMMQLPSTESINDLRVSKFKQRITDTLAVEDLGFYYQLVEQYRQEHNVPDIEIASALARIVQGESPLILKESATTEYIPRADDAPEEKKRPEVRRDRDRADSVPMKRYRLDVGYAHGVKPGSIVGAIANEGGLSGDVIRRIEIYDDFSTVELPASLSEETIHSLKKTRVASRPLNITPMTGDEVMPEKGLARTGGFPKKEGGYEKKEGYPKKDYKKKEYGKDYGKKEGGSYPKREGGYAKKEGGGYPKKEGSSYPKKEGGYAKKEGYPKKEGGYAKKEGFPKKDGAFKKPFKKK